MEDREAHAEYGGRECFPHLHLLPPTLRIPYHSSLNGKVF